MGRTTFSTFCQGWVHVCMQKMLRDDADFETSAVASIWAPLFQVSCARFPAMHLSLVCMGEPVRFRAGSTELLPALWASCSKIGGFQHFGCNLEGFLDHVHILGDPGNMHLSFHISMLPGFSNLKYVPLNPRLGASEAHRSAEPV